MATEVSRVTSVAGPRSVASVQSRRLAAGASIKQMQDKMEEMKNDLSAAKDNSRALMLLLGIDPLMDFEITWVVEEYRAMLQQPLPAGWKIVKHMSGTLHYVHLAHGVDSTEHPALKRFQKLVQYLKWAKNKQQPVNDLFVLELLGPLSDPGEVARMCRRLEIEPTVDAHLTWIAKKAVLEGVPDGWQRAVAADGGVEFVNVRTGAKSRENPTVRIHQQLVRKARLEPRPRLSVLPDLYDWPPARFEPGALDEEGVIRRCKEIPMTGPWMDFWDYYGRRVWYNLETGAAQDELGDMREEACAVAIQRHWRGYVDRREILRLADAVALIEMHWRQQMFRRCIRQVRESRERAAGVIQKLWRAKKTRKEFCEEMIVRIGMLGMKRPMRALARQRVLGLLATPRPFTTIRRKVVIIQRAVRVWLSIRHFELPPDYALVSDMVIRTRTAMNQLWGGFG